MEYMIGALEKGENLYLCLKQPQKIAIFAPLFFGTSQRLELTTSHTLVESELTSGESKILNLTGPKYKYIKKMTYK